MAVLVTTVFGGMVPQAGKRVLPDTASQTATDIAAGTNEFRPMKEDVQVVSGSGVSNPKTIHRLQRKSDGTLNTDFTDSTTWIVNAKELSFARTQLNDDVTERTSYTFNDGSAAPRVRDALGTDRQLGVPKPTTAPTIVVNVVDEFTSEERTGGIEAIVAYLKSSTAALITPVWRGAASITPTDYRPGTTTDGYIDRDTVPGIDPEEAQQLRLFRLTSVGGANDGTISNDYTGSSGQSWPFDPSLGGFYKTATGSGWPTWAGTTADHYCIPFHAYGLTYDINQSGLDAALTAIDMPGGEAGEKLLTSDQVDEIVAKVVEMSTQQWADAAPKLNALYAKVQQAKAVLDSGSTGSLIAATAAFYAKSEITTIFDDAVANAAEAIWNTAVRAASYTEFTPP